MKYKTYCAFIEAAAYNQPAPVDKTVVVAFGLTDLYKFYEQAKEMFKELGIKADEFVTAFKTKRIYSFLKAIHFNLVSLLKAVKAAHDAIAHGFLKVVKELHDTKVFEQLRKGLMKVDDLLDRWPVLKKVTGPVVAGLLFWHWLNAAFFGHEELDLNLETIAKALFGHYDLHELLAGEEGILLLTNMALGLTGLSFPWLGASIANLLLALCYTGLRFAKNNGGLRNSMNVIKTKIKTEKVHASLHNDGRISVTAAIIAQRLAY